MPRRDIWLWALLAAPALLFVAGCGGSEETTEEVVTTEAPAAAATTPAPTVAATPTPTPAPTEACVEHTGQSRYGDDCAATEAGGYCLSMGLSWAVDGTDATCTSGGQPGCTLTNGQACSCTCAEAIAFAAASECKDGDGDHTGVSRYGTDCAATAAGGHCGSSGISWTPRGDTEGVCTQDDRSGCKVTNAQACCISCAPTAEPTAMPTPPPTMAAVETSGYGYGYGFGI